jgi:hypothetical protein
MEAIITELNVNDWLVGWLVILFQGQEVGNHNFLAVSTETITTLRPNKENGQERALELKYDDKNKLVQPHRKPKSSHQPL